MADQSNGSGVHLAIRPSAVQSTARRIGPKPDADEMSSSGTRLLLSNLITAADDGEWPESNAVMVHYSVAKTRTFAVVPPKCGIAT